jgi:hypothetical protein
MGNKKTPWHVNAKIMKTTYYSTLPVAILACCLFAFSCCHKSESACDKSKETAALNVGEKTKIPYNGMDTIILVNGISDTFRFIGSGKSSGEDCKDGTKDPDCPAFTHTLCYENYFIGFKDTSKNLNIGLEQHSWMPPFYHLGKTVDEEDIVVVSIKNNRFYLYTVIIGDARVPQYIAQRDFNGKTYYKVTSCINNFNNPADTLFFSATEGIIQFTLNNGTEKYFLK